MIADNRVLMITHRVVFLVHGDSTCYSCQNSYPDHSSFFIVDSLYWLLVCFCARQPVSSLHSLFLHSLWLLKSVERKCVQSQILRKNALWYECRCLRCVTHTYTLHTHTHTFAHAVFVHGKGFQEGAEVFETRPICTPTPNPRKL